MNTVSRTSLVCAAALLLVVSACAGPASVAPPVEVIIPDTTAVIDDETRDALIEFAEDGTLRFSGSTHQLEELRAGDVVVSEPTAAAPDGYLRRVTSVALLDDGVTVETVHATLEEAVAQGDLSATIELVPEDIETTVTHFEGISFEALPAGLRTLEDGPAFRLDFDRVLVDMGGERVTLDGSYAFEPVFDVDLSVRLSLRRGVRVRNFKILIGYRHEADVTLVGADGLDFEEEVSLKEFTFKTITFKIGPVPVVIKPKVEIILGADGELRADTVYTVSQTANLQAGAEYTRDDGWEDLSNASFGAGFDVEELDGDGTKSSAYVGGKGKLFFYGILGPTATIKGTVETDVVIPRDPVWVLYTGLKVDLGFEVTIKVIGTLVDYKATVVDTKREIARSPNSPPVLEIVFPTDGAELTLNRHLTLVADAFDREDGIPSVRWTSDVEGHLHTNPEVHTIFTTPGPRQLTVTATDSHGESVTETVAVTVVNTPPTPFVSMPDGPVPATAQMFVVGGATDPNDLNHSGEPAGMGVVTCDRLEWSVEPPDDLTAASGCAVGVVFHQQGSRTVTLTATDMHGLASSLAVEVDVGPPPPVPLPIIESITVRDVGGSALPPGVTIGSNVDVPITLEVEASDPEGGPLDYTWEASLDGSPFIEVGFDSTVVWDPNDLLDRPLSAFHVPLLIRVVVENAGGENRSAALEYGWAHIIQ